MLRQHQDSLLLRFAQGEEGHETTTQLSCLVCVDRVSHTVDIHLSGTCYWKTWRSGISRSRIKNCAGR